MAAGLLALAAAAIAPGCDEGAALAPYASEVVSFTPGEGAGFGQARLPGVVLGPPVVHSSAQGSADVLSLGTGGEIVLGFSGRVIGDGPGADLVVFENAFFIGGGAGAVFVEPGEVAVSMDGTDWRTFPCERAGDEVGAGCAGVTPAQPYDPVALVPLDPALTGGDAFDLADVGLATARYVRVRDVGDGGEAPSAGFDLDAVGVVHFAAER
ncbi:MAG: cell surface protein [Deltaproteobacteria bacterium]|nr:cell surface protein [Deltaproteobacteria bacterium]